MKKFSFIVILFLAVFSLQGQSLKGFTLGEKLTGVKHKLTTVAGIDMYVEAQTLKDGRIYSIMALPSEDGKEVDRVYGSDLDALIKGVEKNYNVKLKKRAKDYGDEGYYCTSDFAFYISYDKNQFFDVPYKISLIIRDPDLVKIHEAEEQSKADDDF